MELFDFAINKLMLYEVGKHWNLNHPAVANGLINTADNRKAVGYVNDPLDNGGETKFGVAQSANPELNIKSLSWDAAKRVYFRKYWLASSADDVSLIAPKVSLIHFDGAVNHGVGRASKMLQQALGVIPDGDIGPKTLNALRGIDPDIVCSRLATIRRAFYNGIVAANPSQKRFINGWMARINEVESYAKGIK